MYHYYPHNIAHNTTRCTIQHAAHSTVYKTTLVDALPSRFSFIAVNGLHSFVALYSVPRLPSFQSLVSSCSVPVLVPVQCSHFFLPIFLIISRPIVLYFTLYSSICFFSSCLRVLSFYFRLCLIVVSLFHLRLCVHCFMLRLQTIRFHSLRLTLSLIYLSIPSYPISFHLCLRPVSLFLLPVDRHTNSPAHQLISPE